MYCVIIWIKDSDIQITQTIELDDENQTPDGKLTVPCTGIHRYDGRSGKLLEKCIAEARFQSANDYIVFASEDENSANMFIVGALTVQAAVDVTAFAKFQKIINVSNN